MGYVKHHAIIVTSWDDTRLDEAHAKAIDLCAVVTPISKPGMNRYRSFLVAPDGSKEGWEDSDAGDRARAAFVEWMRTQEAGYLEWVELAYGNDPGGAWVERRPWPVVESVEAG